MFGVSKEDLLKHLENLRMRLCCYMDPNFCDCKYGIPWFEKPTKEEVGADPEAAQEKMKKAMFQFQDFRGLGEQTGCPELRQAIALIKSIPDDEFKKWNHEASVIITDGDFVKALNKSLSKPSKVDEINKRDQDLIKEHRKDISECINRSRGVRNG